jgi:hypothetical protein
LAPQGLHSAKDYRVDCVFEAKQGRFSAETTSCGSTAKFRKEEQ